MFLIERISNKIGHNIASYLNMDKDHEEIISYGALGLLQTSFSILLVIIFGLIFHILIECLIISFSISILRKYSGGVHSSSPNRCAIIGTFISVSLSIITIFILKIFPTIIAFFLFLIGLLYSYYYIYKYAPVGSSSKPLNNIIKRQYLKRFSILVASILYGIACILFLFYVLSKNSNLLVYSFCILIGIVWQTFTLTYLAHILLTKIDCFFIKLQKEE